MSDSLDDYLVNFGKTIEDEEDLEEEEQSSSSPVLTKTTRQFSSGDLWRAELPSPYDTWLTCREAANLVHVSRDKMRRLIKVNKIEFKQFNHGGSNGTVLVNPNNLARICATTTAKYPSYSDTESKPEASEIAVNIPKDIDKPKQSTKKELVEEALEDSKQQNEYWAQTTKKTMDILLSAQAAMAELKSSEKLYVIAPYEYILYGLICFLGATGLIRILGLGE